MFRKMMLLFFAPLFVSGAVQKNYTVTEEVFLDMEIKDYDGPGENLHGRIVIGLFGDTLPMTTLNFAKIAEGFKLEGRSILHYKNTYAIRLVKDFMVQFGDVVNGDGSGSRSIYGEMFVDENYILSHRSMGMVSMTNRGKDTNGSQFIFTLKRSRWLDGMNVLFGKILKGMDILKAINEVETDRGSGSPKKPIKIVNSGILGLAEKYALTDEQIDAETDLVN